MLKNKNLRFTQTGSYSVTDPFLTFYYVEKRNGILSKNRGKGFEKSYVRLHGGRGVQKLLKSCLRNYVITDYVNTNKAINESNIS